MSNLIQYIAKIFADLCVFVAAVIGFIALLHPAFPRWLRIRTKRQFTEMKANNPKFFGGFFYTTITVVLALYVANAVLGWRNYRREHEPEVSANIHYPRHGKLPDTNRVAIVMDMQVMNDGSPTRLWKWKCLVEFDSGKVVSSEAPHEWSGLDEVFTKDNYLPTALFKNPIGAGGENGWVWFPFEKTNELELFYSNATFTVECTDRLGRPVRAKYRRNSH